MTTWRVFAALSIAAALGGVLAFAYLAYSDFPIGLALAFGMVAAAGFAFFCFAKPYAAVLIIFFTIPFEMLTVVIPADSYGSGTVINYITFVKLMFGALIVTGLTRLLVLKDERPLREVWRTPIPVLLLLFEGMLWMSLANAKHIGGFAIDMMSIGSGIIAFFILIILLTTRERLYLFLKVVFFSYIIISLMGLFEAVTQQHVLELLGFPMIDRPWVTNPSAFRVCGPSGDPDYYAVSVIFGLMVTFAILPLVKGVIKRAGVMLVVVLHFVIIVATASRGAALSTALALGVFYLFARFKHKVVVGAVAVAILAGAFTVFSLAVSGKAAKRYTEGDTQSWDERWGWIRMCYAMMMDAPVRGVGSGNFQGLYTQYMGTYVVPRYPEHAQNTYAQLAAQNGIPTTLVYLAANAVLWFVLYWAMRRTRDRKLEHVAVSFFSLSLSFWLFSLTLGLVEWEITWINFALGVVISRLVDQEQAERETAGMAHGLPGGPAGSLRAPSAARGRA
jgi:hypothetical protein